MKKLVIVDLSNFIFRAYYAIRPLNSPDGKPVNAVYGVLTMLLKLIEQQKPTHLVMAKDTKSPSFRKAIYPEYKANRSAPPEDLIPQFELIAQMLTCFDIPQMAIDGYEADDIIGSIVMQMKDEFDQVLIASGDKDLMQFVDSKVFILDTMKDLIIDSNQVKEKMGVFPKQIVDYLSLLGDASDNIPGVSGIGAKGAAKLIEEFSSLDEILKNKDKIGNKKARESLTANENDAILSKKLVEIKCDIALPLEHHHFFYDLKIEGKQIDFLLSLGFKSLLKKLEGFTRNTELAVNLNNNVNDVIQRGEQIFHEVLNPDQGQELLTKLKLTSQISMIVWDKMAILYDSKEIHFFSTELDSMLENILNLNIVIYVSDTKSILHHLTEDSLDKIKAVLFDISMAAFNIDPDLYTAKKSYDLSMINIREIIASDVISLFESGLNFQEKIKEFGVEKIFYELDLKMFPVIVKMEKHGLKIDKEYLYELEKILTQKIKDIERKVSEISSVNLRSPKQVADLLFNKMQLPVIKKNKTGPSTDSSVLEKLYLMTSNPITQLILSYRELDKLLSTYVTVLPKLISSETERLHTHFNQDVAATGRLSSDNPNLQNIPIRSEYGKLIRKAFIPSDGSQLLSADYSQIELRVLAHFSQDPTMLKSFLEDKDIHAQTASDIFNVPLNFVNDELRAKAKAINFGLMYGQSSFGLSEQLNIPQADARNYITNYFQKFGAVKAFLDTLKDSCESKGYAETLLGRKRIVKQIKSSNRTIKSIGERIAINSPIQGTSADIIKLAMISIDHYLTEHHLKSKMILQIHDELIFEVPHDEVKIMEEVVREKMETVVSLSVPLKVNLSVGHNWFEMS